MSNNLRSKLINITSNGKSKTFCIYQNMPSSEFQKIVSFGLSLPPQHFIVGLRDKNTHEVIMLSTVVEHPEVMKNTDYTLIFSDGIF